MSNVVPFRRRRPWWWPVEDEPTRWWRAGGRERAEAFAAWTPYEPTADRIRAEEIEEEENP